MSSVVGVPLVAFVEVEESLFEEVGGVDDVVPAPVVLVAVLGLGTAGLVSNLGEGDVGA